MIRKKEKSDNIWDKVINSLWYLLFGFMLFMCVLIFLSNTGHCATIDSFYDYYPMHQNNGGKFSDAEINFINNYFDSDNNYIFAFWSYNYNGYDYIYLFYTDKSLGGMLYGELHNNITSFSFYNIGLVSLNYRLLGYKNDSDFTVTYINNNDFASIGYDWCVVSNFKLYTNNNPDTQKLLLKYGSDVPVIDYGHATPPDEFHNPYFNPNSHAQPPEEVPPQVTINNYIWNTYNPPAIDDTDIISTLKSLIYVVNYLMGWLKDNISGEFQNLLSNLKGFFDYIGQTIQYYGGLIIDNIQNLITTFYNNMVSLVEDIAEKVGYISEPFDSIALTNAFESMQIYDDYDRCCQLIDDAFGFFDDISEPTSFTIPIDLRGITLLHQTQILYFDLGWINSAKSVIRAFMWTVTTFGLLYTVIDSIPDYLQGQDE